MADDTKEMSNTSFFFSVFAMLFGGGWFYFYMNPWKLNHLYFNAFEIVHVLGFLALSITCFFLARMLRKKTHHLSLRASLLEPLRQREEATFIGETSDEVELFLSDKDRCSHVQVIGSTGRGKTESIVLPWMVRDYLDGKSSILIDGKGSQDLLDQLKERIYVEDDLKVFCLDHEDSIKINPLKNGSAQQIVDRIFSSFDFDDSYFRAVQYDICGYLIRLIISVGEDVSFKVLHELLSNDYALSKMIARSKNQELKKRLNGYLKENKEKRFEKVSGLTSQLSPFATGEISTLVNGGDGEVNIEHALDARMILAFSISTLKYQRIGHQLGKIILQDLAWAIGERESKKPERMVSVFLDEFSEFVYEGFISILNKARSAKVALHLSHQSVGDLSKISASFCESVNTNTNIKVILGINDPETADFYARHIGTETASKRTEQFERSGFFGGEESTGRMSLRDVESYRIHPNVLKNLFHGKGVIHVPKKHGSITEVIQFKRLNEGGEY